VRWSGWELVLLLSLLIILPIYFIAPLDRALAANPRDEDDIAMQRVIVSKLRAVKQQWKNLAAR